MRVEGEDDGAPRREPRGLARDGGRSGRSRGSVAVEEAGDPQAVPAGDAVLPESRGAGGGVRPRALQHR